MISHETIPFEFMKASEIGFTENSRDPVSVGLEIEIQHYDRKQDPGIRDENIYINHLS